jgi:hypothetical protein
LISAHPDLSDLLIAFFTTDVAPFLCRCEWRYVQSISRKKGGTVKMPIKHWMRISLSGSALALGTLSLAGCVYERPRHYYVYDAPPPPPGDTVVVVADQPPPDQEEVIGVAPYDDGVWIRGHYVWSDGRWWWTRGYWSHRPRPGVVWVDGRYEHRRGSYVYVGGTWR